MATVNDVIIIARRHLGDPLGKRFNAADMLRYYNEALLMFYSERPDVFSDASVTGPPQAASVGTTIDSYYDAQFRQTHAFYIAALAETRPDEEASMARSERFLALARQ